MINLKENKGITIITLIIIIIVISIIASITIGQGTTLVKQINVDNYKTNMISIRAKSKVIVEEVNSKTWDVASEDKAAKRKELLENDYAMTKTDISSDQESKLDSTINSEYESYRISQRTMELMGLSDIDNIEKYIVVFDVQDTTKLDVIYDDGIKFNKKTYYTLSNLQAEMGE